MSTSRRNLGLSITRGILLLIAQIPALRSHPIIGKPIRLFEEDGGDPEGDPESGQFWIYIGVSLSLVLLGGCFAGLTLGLMGQDEIYLQVIEQSGESHEKKNASRVLRLLKRGKHWVLVTLLLSNVITNETLPIVLDRSLGGGWPAVLSSTILIVIFGEIIPQSVCVRYGLAIGAYLAPFVLALMYLMFPVAYPTALLLDRILGEDHGTTYKKAGLKTLVTLHKTLGPSPGDRLNQDEVTIITAVLDLKDKPVGSIMTPIKDVFTMSSDTILDEDTMDNILHAGYSRIPIHAPGEPTNFVGMLLVKMLITYDPEDAFKVSHFSLATLPETAPETSCLDIVNFFQEGKSHMVMVSEYPGENYGALGVVTLEDVIEELIGEEIIDESDVYIDVHKAIRRLNPAPIARRAFSSHVVPKDKMSDQTATAAAHTVANAIAGAEDVDKLKPDSAANAEDGPIKPGNMKRKLSDNLPPELVASLRHLGPSNKSSNPKKTHSKTVKIKIGSQDDHSRHPSISGAAVSSPVSSPVKPRRTVSWADVPPSETTRLTADVDDGDQPHSYGTDGQWTHVRSTSPIAEAASEPSPEREDAPTNPTPAPAGVIVVPEPAEQEDANGQGGSNSQPTTPSAGASGDTSPSLLNYKRVKTGSLVEINREIGGVTKIVVEATSSDDSEETSPKDDAAEASSGSAAAKADGNDAAGEDKKKKKKKKKKKGGKKGGNGADKIDEEGEDDNEETGLLKK